MERQEAIGKSEPSVAIYKVLIGKYDYCLNDLYQDKSIDYYLITDCNNNHLHGYTKLTAASLNVNNSLTNRFYKFNPPPELHEYDIKIYIDANYVQLGTFQDLINEFWQNNCNVGVFKNPYSANTLDEFDNCIKHNKADANRVRLERQYFVSMLKRDELPVSDNSIVFMKNDKNINEMMFALYDHLTAYTGRDQLSLFFIAKLYDEKIHIFNFSPRVRNWKKSYVMCFPHKSSGYSIKKIVKLYALRVEYALRWLASLQLKDYQD